MRDVRGETLEIVGPAWTTPLTFVPPRQVGAARIRHETYARHFYDMEGVNGYASYRVVEGPLVVTLLQRRHPRDMRRWKIWMVDDPLHWYAMGQRVSDLPAGSVLVAGLGLGLMLHHMRMRADLTRIVVVEVDADVIRLIRPTLPDDPRVEIVEADYYDYIQNIRWRPDSVLWDLAVGGFEDTLPDFVRARATAAVWLPEVPLYRFGDRRREPVL